MLWRAGGVAQAVECFPYGPEFKTPVPPKQKREKGKKCFEDILGLKKKLGSYLNTSNK
jgi:hypothetical protein